MSCQKLCIKEIRDKCGYNSWPETLRNIVDNNSCIDPVTQQPVFVFNEGDTIFFPELDTIGGYDFEDLDGTTVNNTFNVEFGMIGEGNVVLDGKGSANFILSAGINIYNLTFDNWKPAIKLEPTGTGLTGFRLEQVTFQNCTNAGSAVNVDPNLSEDEQIHGPEIINCKVINCQDGFRFRCHTFNGIAMGNYFENIERSSDIGCIQFGKKREENLPSEGGHRIIGNRFNNITGTSSDGAFEVQAIRTLGEKIVITDNVINDLDTPNVDPNDEGECEAIYFKSGDIVVANNIILGYKGVGAGAITQKGGRKNVQIINNIVESETCPGIYAVAGDTHILGNQVTSTAGVGIDIALEDLSATIERHVIISENSVSANQQAIYVRNASNIHVYIQNNPLIESSGSVSAIWAEGPKSITITDNGLIRRNPGISEPNGRAIFLGNHDIDDVVIANNSNIQQETDQFVFEASQTNTIKRLRIANNTVLMTCPQRQSIMRYSALDASIKDNHFEVGAGNGNNVAIVIAGGGGTHSFANNYFLVNDQSVNGLNSFIYVDQGLDDLYVKDNEFRFSLVQTPQVASLKYAINLGGNAWNVVIESNSFSKNVEKVLHRRNPDVDFINNKLGIIDNLYEDELNPAGSVQVAKLEERGNY